MASEQNVGLVAKPVQKKIKLIPPDGGWGWMVLMGTAVSNIFNQSMLSLFSLLYGDALEAMGHNTQGAAIVLSTMLFVTNFGGPIAGVVMNLTSPRFVAVSGAFFCSSGIFLSGFATNIWHLVFTYGILLGAGLGFIQSSTFVAINSYFMLRKSRAVGLANAGTGIGQTLIPHLVRYLLENFGFRGACMILSALSLHGIAGCMLLQPVEWHLKEVEEEVEVDENMYLLDDNKVIVRKNSETDGNLARGRKSIEPYLNNSEKVLNKSISSKELSLANSKSQINNGTNNNIVAPTEQKTVWKKMYDLLDISLLSSPRFLNIIFGTALSVTSIQNFSMLFPFFLQKQANLNKQQTATCMSAVAAADITGRLVLPIFQDKFRIKARYMIIMTSIWLIITRQILAYQTGFEILIAMAALYGSGRSMVIVARNLAISEYCKLEQVPAAVGLGMLTMGIIVPPAGFFLGWIRDYTGSYITCITAQNILLVVVLVTWIPDMILIYFEERRQKKKDLDAIQLH